MSCYAIWHHTWLLILHRLWLILTQESNVWVKIHVLWWFCGGRRRTYKSLNPKIAKNDELRSELTFNNVLQFVEMTVHFAVVYDGIHWKHQTRLDLRKLVQNSLHMHTDTHAHTFNWPTYFYSYFRINQICKGESRSCWSGFFYRLDALSGAELTASKICNVTQHFIYYILQTSKLHNTSI